MAYIPPADRAVRRVTTPPPPRRTGPAGPGSTQSRSYADVYRRAQDQMSFTDAQGTIRRPTPNPGFTPGSVSYMSSYDRGGMGPDTGMSADQLAQAMLTGPVANQPPGGPGGGSGRGRGSGGGSGGSAVNPAVQAAYQALLLSMQNNGADKRFDDLSTQVTGLRDSGASNIRGILAEMDARAAQARAATGQAFQQGDQRLQALGSQYGANAEAEQNNLNRILSSFDAGRADVGPSQIDSLVGAGRVANTQGQTGYDTLFADRGAISAGLGSDILTQQSRQADALQAQIAAQRVQEQLAREQQLAQLRLQAAQAGITL